MNRVEGTAAGPEGCGNGPEGTVPWTFASVEERLIEAWGFLRRMPDREAGWLRTSTMSLWRQSVSDRSERWLDRDEDRPVRVGLRTAEVERMTEALQWVERWGRPVDMPVLAEAIAFQAEERDRPDWFVIWERVNNGSSPDALRKRYDRAISGFAIRLNRLISGVTGASR
ncbi:hypothetical protein [Sphingomonas sp. ID0503]|uniref:hypothetical protein n=1 Tax=Sphingomonas sp. ID0503 TaxID=3399691 RepID=UPI003AFA5A58